MNLGPRISTQCVSIGVALACSLTALGSTALPAQAKCNPGRASKPWNAHADWRLYEGSSQIGGVKTYLLNYSPWVKQDVSAWPMLDDPVAGFYAQDGWAEEPNNDRHIFAEWTPDGGTWDDKYWGADSVGSTSSYDVLYLNHQNAFSFGWDGNEARDDEFASFAPTTGDVAGEIQDMADQMPGDTNQNESFDYTQAWVGQAGSGNGGWQDFGPAGAYTGLDGTPPNWYATQVWDPNHHFVTRDPVC